MRWAIGLLAFVAVTVTVGVIALVVVTGSSTTAVADLEVGDCFDFPQPDPAATEDDVEVVQGVDVIDCDGPHQAEVVLAGELNPDGDLEYPSDADLFELVDRRCQPLAGQVGPDFGLLPIAPIEATWNRFGGRFQCVAIAFGGATTTGSLSVGAGSD